MNAEGGGGGEGEGGRKGGGGEEETETSPAGVHTANCTQINFFRCHCTFSMSMKEKHSIYSYLGFNHYAIS